MSNLATPSFGSMASPPACVSRPEAPAVSLWRVHAVLLLVQCGYAGAFVLSKVALTTGVNAIVFAFYRDVIALCAFAPVAYFAERGKRGRLDLTTLGLLALLGLIGIFSSQLLLLFGLKLATASLSSIVSITIPICVFFISAVFGLEEINWRRFDGQAKVGGLISAVVGGVFIALYKGPAILGVHSLGLHSSPGSELQLDGNGISPVTILDLSIETWQIGVILLFLAGICFGIFITLQVPVLKRYPAPVSLTASSCFFGALAIGILGLITVEDSEWVIREPSAIISVLYVGVISSGANHACTAWVNQKAGPLLPASYNPLQLFLTSTLAASFIGESIHLGSVLGSLLIISGLYLITWGKIKGRKLGARSVEDVTTRDGLPTIKAISNLEEPLLR